MIRRTRSCVLTVEDGVKSPLTLIRDMVAVQRDARSHKLNVRMRSHWGYHDLTTLVLLQPQTAPDGPATEPKRSYPRMNLRHYLYRAVGHDTGA